ncbi:hypothetical protein BDZ88DRAFT_511032 [Geranomyces variabilis]|nr:hypothetical protein BDZ88DRAFT_511032 [Geranomyces variabilis]KAJ3134987.1 hypothetical protein HDU90_004312 [Geranomyces variabilis]
MRHSMFASIWFLFGACPLAKIELEAVFSLAKTTAPTWSSVFSRLKTYLDVQVPPTAQTQRALWRDKLPRLTKAYRGNVTPYTIDLALAAKRQRGFTAKMCAGPGWCDEHLGTAITRYHKFLKLMKASPNAFFVPTPSVTFIFQITRRHGARFTTVKLFLNL